MNKEQLEALVVNLTEALRIYHDASELDFKDIRDLLDELESSRSEAKKAFEELEKQIKEQFT